MNAQNPDEIFDVVDENDAVIDQKPRGHIHANGLRHRAVHILLYNKQGQLYLQRRAPGKDTFPNCWDSSCSGHVDSGEDYDEAAARELVEELGVSLNRIIGFERLFKLEACAQTGHEFIWVYHGICEGPFYTNPAEIAESRFFNADEIDQNLAANSADFAAAFAFLWPRLAKG